MSKESNQGQGQGHEGRCGWGCFQPDCLQMCHNTKCLLVTLCIMIFVQGMNINGFLPSSVSTLETRFQMSSTQTGTILVAYDVSMVLVLVFVGYFGNHGHKGRWIAIGCLGMAISTTIFTLPHFTTGVYKGSRTAILCERAINGTNLACSSEDQGLSNYFYVFFFAHFLAGLACSSMFTLAFVYLDENTSRKSSSLFTAIYYSVSVLGPGVGIVLGGVMLRIHGDIGFVDLDTIQITSDDPSWYGAWWLSFLMAAALSLLISFPLFGFAAALPGQKEKHDGKLSEVHQNSSTAKFEEILEESNDTFGKKLKDLPTSIKHLFLNPVYVCIILCDSTEGFLTGGFVAFAAKYLQYQFSIGASSASIYTGLVVIPAGAGGSLLSGYIMKRFNFSASTILKYSTIVLFGSLVSSVGILVRCENSPFAGVTSEYQTGELVSGLGYNLSAPCNQDCICDNSFYNPICGVDNIMYFSPCHAGCIQTGKKIDANIVYQNCSCVQGLATNISSSSNSSAILGPCKSSCQLMPLYLSLLFFIILFTFMAATPTIQAILRVVPDTQRSIATGVAWLFVRILGLIPGPIVFGVILDNACILWGEECGDRTSCHQYDNEKMSLYFTGLSVGLKVLSVSLMFLAWWLYVPPDTEESKEKDQGENGIVHSTKL